MVVSMFNCDYYSQFKSLNYKPGEDERHSVSWVCFRRPFAITLGCSRSRRTPEGSWGRERCAVRLGEERRFCELLRSTPTPTPTATPTPTPTRVLQLSQRSLLIFEFLRQATAARTTPASSAIVDDGRRCNTHRERIATPLSVRLAC
jgi:hypothetical protein